MKNAFIGILITMMMVAVSNAAVPVVVVDASPNHVSLSSGSAVVNLTATVTGEDSLDGWVQNTGNVVFSTDPVTFGDESALSTTVTFTTAGLYNIGFEATNASGIGKDKILIRVCDEGETGLIGYWPLDGETTGATPQTLDTSGNGKDGDIVGEPQFVDGIIGQAMQFDGIDDGVTIENDDLSYFNTPVYTLSCWVKIPYGARPEGVIVGKKDYTVSVGGDGAPDEYKGFGWGLDSYESRQEGSPTWIGYTTAGNRVEITPDSLFFNTLNDGKWHHYAAVADYVSVGSEKKNYHTLLYVDGAYVGVNDNVLSSQALNLFNETPLSFGHTASFPGLKNWAGYLDDVQFYSYPLSDTDILAIYNAGTDNGAGCGELGDINGDCNVDLNDYVLLAQDWLK